MRARRKAAGGLVLSLVAILVGGYGAPLAAKSATTEEGPLDLTSASTTTRIRASLAWYKFTLKGANFTGTGPEFSFENAFTTKWSLAGSLGQAYSMQDHFSTLFTSLEIALWYSAWGHFWQERQVWRDQGKALVRFAERRQAGLRLGLGTQQYYFNTSTGAVPFSGLAFKALYEFGLKTPFDLGLGIDVAQVANAADKALAWRFLASFIYPLGD